MMQTVGSHSCLPWAGSPSLSPMSARTCVLRTPSSSTYTTRRLPQPLQIPAIPQRPAVLRRSSRVIVCRATPSPTPPNSKLKRSIWTAVDVVALLGSVGGALAALLGVVSPTYALVLPLVLPVVSLIAALQREDLSNEEGRQYLSELSSSIGRDSAALLREAAAAIEEVRRESRNQAAAAARLSAIEDKLAVLEGAMVGAARSSREAAMGVSALGSALSQTLQQNPAALGQGAISQQTAQMLAGYVSSEVVPGIKAELAGSLGPWLAETGNSLKQLDTRLAVVEGSLAGLEMAQSEGLRRLSGSISSSLVDAESALQSSVRVEVATAVEPLKQLPQLVAAAAAKAAAQQQQQALLLPDALEPADSQQRLVVQSSASTAVTDQAALVEQLRELMAAEVASATQQLLNQQAEVLSALSQPPKPAPLADDQWEALGRRLARLERLVQSVPELGEQAIAGQIAPLLAAQQQQQQQQATSDMQDAAALKLASVAEQMSSSYEQLSSLIRDFEGARGKLDDAARQIAASNVSVAPADQAAGSGFAGADQLVQQLQDSVQQLLQQSQQQQQQQQVQGSAAGAEVSDLVRSLQQQVQGLGAALQQVQMDIPAQIQLAFQQSVQAAAAARGEAYDGTAYEDSYSSNAAAAASAAATAASASAAAAQGIAEVRQLLGSVQQACNDLQVQVGTLSAQVAAQQAALFSSQQEAAAAAAAGQDSSSSSQADAVLLAAQAAQQQLAEASSQLSSDLSGQLSGLCSSLEQQLQELQRQLVSAATAAASQAAAEAAAAAATAVSASNSIAAGTLQQHDGTASPAAAAAAASAAEPYYEEVAAGGWAGYQQQQQPPLQQPGNWQAEGFTAAAAAAAPLPQQSPSSSWSAPLGDDSSAVQQQQSAGQTVGSTALPPQQQQQQAASPAAPAAAAAPRPVIPDISSLTEEQLRTEGLRLLRAGREATSGTGTYVASGPDFAAAEVQLQAAVACFGKAVESEPQDTRALGNLGNALLAQGELKKSLLDELRLSAAQGGFGFGGSAAAQQQNLAVAENRLRGEAVGQLTRAGEIFRRVLEVDGWSSRALVNWGKALVGRAELAVDITAATKLYNAAIDKFEAVLEEDPGMIVAKYRCALAMQGLAALNPEAGAGQQGSGSRQWRVLLQDAAAYLADVVAAGAGGDDVLRDAAAAALRQVQEQLGLAGFSK